MFLTANPRSEMIFNELRGKPVLPGPGLLPARSRIGRVARVLEKPVTPCRCCGEFVQPVGPSLTPGAELFAYERGYSAPAEDPAVNFRNREGAVCKLPVHGIKAVNLDEDPSPDRFGRRIQPSPQTR